MHHLFRRCAVKAWFQTNFSANKCKVLNRIASKMCVEYCNKCWKQRNEVLQDKKKCKERLVR